MKDLHPNFIQSYFHGTKTNLNVGDLIVPGSNANYGERKSKFVYATSNLNVAIWGAEMAVGDDCCRIYIVEPMGSIENDPNLTDKKFPGNPTNSFRVREGFKVVAEVKNWQGHSSEEIKVAREKIDLALKNGAPIIED
ncbi:MAG: NAD(+)--rifampin ADP-ribosyltransferase [Proteobacteria bacterium]|nr:NAD(+)--rifampin ADP-ribosyltransferase [Pseudomonadota bacterium]